MKFCQKYRPVIAFTAATALIGLIFSCAQFSLPSECRSPNSPEVRERCDQLTREQLPERRPIYMNGR